MIGFCLHLFILAAEAPPSDIVLNDFSEFIPSETTESESSFTFYWGDFLEGESSHEVDKPLQKHFVTEVATSLFAARSETLLKARLHRVVDAYSLLQTGGKDPQGWRADAHTIVRNRLPDIRPEVWAALNTELQNKMKSLLQSAKSIKSLDQANTINGKSHHLYRLRVQAPATPTENESGEKPSLLKSAIFYMSGLQQVASVWSAWQNISGSGSRFNIVIPSESKIESLEQARQIDLGFLLKNYAMVNASQEITQ